MTRAKHISIREIASELGLAKVTVSVCLSGKAAEYKIKADTVKRVQEYAAKVGFVPNAAARQLRQKGAGSPVALVLDNRVVASEIASPGVALAIRRLASAGREFRIIGAKEIPKAYTQARQLGCREMIVFSCISETTNDAEDALFRQQESRSLGNGIETCFVNYNFPAAEPLIYPDSVRIGINRFRVLQMLRKLFTDEFGGQIFSTYRLLNNEPHVISCPFSADPMGEPFEFGRSAADFFLEKRKEYDLRTAILGDDRSAAGFMGRILDSGLKIPEDLQILSFDNLEFARYLAVPLSTWGVPIAKSTELALDCLLDNRELPALLEVKPEFSWRGTTSLSAKAINGFNKSLDREFPCHLTEKTTVPQLNT